MKTVKIKLTDGGEQGEVSLEIARNMIANGHAVLAGKPKPAPKATAKTTKGTDEDSGTA